MKILFVASNPSIKSPDNSAMHMSTKSRKIIETWISNIDADVEFCNVCDMPTDANKPLSKKQILSNCKDLEFKIQKSNCDYIVALGNSASYALDYLNIKHLKLPHPSGLNRKLNDRGVVDDIKTRLYEIAQGKNNIENMKNPKNGGNNG